jgi:tetratricopeptide (TPR) repeat protein
LLVLFVAVTAVSAAALGWASWELVLQDRDLARQRAQERRDSAAALAVGSLQRTLDALDAQLITLASVPPADLAGRASDYARTLPDEAVLLVVRADEVAAYPAGRLLYYPVVPSVADVPASAFAAADLAEFQQNDHAKAVSLLRPMATSGLPAVRAEALLRIARNLRKAGRRQQAIETYGELARLGDVRISDTNGAPAELVARAAICDLLAEQHDTSRLTATDTRAT